jgi:hypothetical protein
MPFINAKLNEAQESIVVPEGEYDLRNHSAEIKDSKKGAPMVVVLTVVESAEFPNAQPITTYMSLPQDDDEPKAAAFKLLQLRRFCEAFEIPFEDNGFNTDDIAGTTATLMLKQETYEEEGKEPFVSNKIILPRLSSEPAEEEKPQPKKKAAAGRHR